MFQLPPNIKTKLQNKLLVIGVVVVAIILYIGVSIVVVKNLTVKKTQPSAAYPTDSYGRRVSVPTPTPTPAKGPGAYACSSTGDCNLYGDKERKDYCKTTYADPRCLGQCSDSSKRCTK